MKAIQTVLLLALCHLCMAQVPTLSVHRENGNEHLQISQLDITVEVVGNIATTTFDMVFYNPFSKVLEGELSMPLKAGQEICRYALDINGTLREGVIVEKIKARQTFEAVVRKKVDPGIINKTKGNNFNTKIYPIPSRGSKRVVIALSETLHGDDDKIYYSLPFGNLDTINQFSLNVKSIKRSIVNDQMKSEFQNIQFDDKGEAYVLHFERNNYVPTEPLNFTIPRFSKEDYQLFTYDFEGDTYFYLNTRPDKLYNKAKVKPENIAIFWDNSFSASKRDKAKELELLQQYLNTLLPRTKISVTAFHNITMPTQTFIAADAADILSYITSLENDGATCLDNIIFPKNADEILLFSDGVNTIGGDKIQIPQTPIFAITSSAGSHYSLLNRLCTKTNGEFIDLSILTNERALQLLTVDEEKFLSYDYDAKAIKELYPNIPTRVDKYFDIVGILVADEAQLSVHYGGKNGIKQTKTYTIRKT